MESSDDVASLQVSLESEPPVSKAGEGPRDVWLKHEERSVSSYAPYSEVA